MGAFTSRKDLGAAFPSSVEDQLIHLLAQDFQVGIGGGGVGGVHDVGVRIGIISTLDASGIFSNLGEIERSSVEPWICKGKNSDASTDRRSLG